MSASSTTDKDFDVCGICHELFSDDPKDPRLKTPIRGRECVHTYCRECLQNLQVSKMEEAGGRRIVNLRCPACRKKSFRADNLIPDLSFCRALARIRLLENRVSGRSALDNIILGCSSTQSISLKETSRVVTSHDSKKHKRKSKHRKKEKLRVKNEVDIRTIFRNRFANHSDAECTSPEETSWTRAVTSPKSKEQERENKHHKKEKLKAKNEVDSQTISFRDELTHHSDAESISEEETSSTVAVTSPHSEEQKRMNIKHHKKKKLRVKYELESRTLFRDGLTNHIEAESLSPDETSRAIIAPKEHKKEKHLKKRKREITNEVDHQTIFHDRLANKSDAGSISEEETSRAVISPFSTTFQDHFQIGKEQKIHSSQTTDEEDEWSSPNGIPSNYTGARTKPSKDRPMIVTPTHCTVQQNNLQSGHNGTTDQENDRGCNKVNLSIGNADLDGLTSVDSIIRYMDIIDPGKRYYDRQQDNRGGCSKIRGKLRKHARQNNRDIATAHWVETSQWKPPTHKILAALIALLREMINDY